MEKSNSRHRKISSFLGNDKYEDALALMHNDESFSIWRDGLEEHEITVIKKSDDDYHISQRGIDDEMDVDIENAISFLECVEEWDTLAVYGKAETMSQNRELYGG